jgi:hypothetical protein
MVPADERLTAAINAANAAAHAAYAAECAARLANNMEPLISGVAGCAAWTAGFATKAEADADSERKWQIETLCEYLLKRRETIDLRV